MADPNDTASSLTNAAVAATDAQSALSGFGSAVDRVKGVLDDLDDKLKSVGISLEENHSLTAEQTEQFGLLTTMVLGARESFRAFGDIDFRNVSTFTGQIKDLVDILGQGNNAISSLKGVAWDAFKVIIPEDVINKGIGAVKNFIMNLATSADNALRLQSAYVQLSAKTGGLADVYEAAGPHLEKINLLLEKQQLIVNSTAQATGLSTEVIEQYYMELGNIPKALSSTVEGAGTTNHSISLLTASIQLATGSGRKYSDVVADLREAFRAYNLTGEDALRFTARMSEISNKFGIELSDVRESLNRTAETFKMFGNESEAAAHIMNNYLASLQNTGVSGATAVDIISNMTDKMKDLSLAQKSFLSAQTGGPGGLMGAFQIEQMLREGKLDEVFEKVRTQMSRQFGQIVTLEDASKNPAAAAQLTRQIMIMRQGPLGQFARSDQEAIRILEAFKGRAEGKVEVKGLSDSIIKDTMGKGTDLQQKSYTELSRIRALLERTQGTAGIANLGFMQQSFAAGAGTPTITGEFASKMKDNLIQFMSKGAEEGGKVTKLTAQELSSKALTDMSGEAAATIISDYSKFFEQLPDSIKAPIEKLKSLFMQGKEEDAETEVKSLMNEINMKKEAVKKMAKSMQGPELAKLDQEAQTLMVAAAYLKTSKEQLSGTAPTTVLPQITSPTELGINPIPQLKKATTTVAKLPATTGTGVTAPAVTTAMGPSEITVHITGFCLRCKQEIEGGDQLASISPQAKKGL